MIVISGRHRRSFASLATAVLVAVPVAAQTSGPTQPEFQPFAPASVRKMVDLFSGDLHYTIPLFDLPGPNGKFPFSLSYSSGIGLAQEASWVGLGWNLTPGLITREVRGVPDDFTGDLIKYTHDALPNFTAGLGVSANFELFGADAAIGVGLTAGVQGYFNNYRGLGFKRDIGVAASLNNMGGTGLTADLGTTLSLDTQSGASFEPSASLSYRSQADASKFQVGSSLTGSINSRQGLTSLSLGMNYSFQGLGSGVLWSYSRPVFAPAIPVEMDGESVAITAKVGASVWGGFADLGFTGFFNRQYVRNAGQAVSAPGYGYLYLQNGSGDDAVLDFSRDRDGILRKESPNLAIPSLTHDLYLASGPNVGGTFRAFRNDVGILKDRKAESNNIGFGAGVEIGGGGIAHWGVDGSVTSTKTTVSGWTTDNNVPYAFGAWLSQKPEYEPVYFKFIGEPSLRAPAQKPSLIAGTSIHPVAWNPLPSIGNEAAVRVKLGDSGLEAALDQGRYPTYPALATLQSADATEYAMHPALDSSRVSRQTNIQAFTNGDLVRFAAALPELLVSYLAEDGSKHLLDRSSRPTSQIGAFIITTPEGTRNVYGLAAYTNSQIDEQFSVEQPAKRTDSLATYGGGSAYLTSGSEQSLSRTELPAYAHAYLLTAVLGPDYVDADGVAGPSDGDPGHWVRFTYQRTTSTYRWRAPFSGVSYARGYENTGGLLSGDKGSLSTGTRENWILIAAETRTHIAEFSISKRRDGKGAHEQYQNTPQFGESSYKLDSASLFSKPERIRADGSVNSQATPITRVQFEYTYMLAEGVPNHDATTPDGFSHDVKIDGVSYGKGASRPGSGKLTLKRLWFEYGHSTRARLNPYEFGYGESDAAENPSYVVSAQDRWGTYKPYTDFPRQSAFPYTDQQDTLATNARATSWLLKSIILPSSAALSIKYESDRYGFVQNKRAMEMDSVVGVGAEAKWKIDDADPRRVYFALKTPIPASAAAPSSEEQAKLAKYFDGLDQVYFKLRLELKSGHYEFVAGFADVNPSAGYGSGYGFGTAVADPAGTKAYRTAWVLLQPTDTYHPFSLAAWQHLRLNQPELLSPPPISVDPRQSPISQIGQVPNFAASLVSSSVQDLISLSIGFNHAASTFGWGVNVDPTRAKIRLNDPDGAKLGGGARVKEIVVNDGWKEANGGADSSSLIGQRFFYIDEDGTSSGVAAYEPAVGMEENPFHVAKRYTQSMPFSSDFQLFFEHPINETSFPGPAVGYNRVVVRSIVTDSVLRTTNSLTPNAGSTGQSVSTFYTARDFPTRVDETPVDKDPYDLTIPIPFIGQLSVGNLTASQGYSAVLNDMHGKPRTVAEYGVSDKGTLLPEPISLTEYKYVSTPTLGTGGVQEFDLDTRAPALRSWSAQSGLKGDLGLDVDFFIDMRQTHAETLHGGVRINADVVLAGFFPIPIPVPWPNVGLAVNEGRTVVANKIVYKTATPAGSRTVHSGAATVVANVVYDELNGEPVLTSATNTFNDPVYLLSTRAHWFYQGMGPAFRTSGIRISGTTTSQTGTPTYTFKPSSGIGLLQAGDEFALSWSIGNQEQSARAWVQSVDAAAGSADLRPTAEPGGQVEALLVRTAARNLLALPGQTVKALRNPLTQVAQSCVHVDSVPCGVRYDSSYALTLTTCASLAIPYAIASRDAGRADSPNARARIADKNLPARCREEFAFLGRGFGSDVWKSIAAQKCSVTAIDNQRHSVPLSAINGISNIRAASTPPNGVTSDPQTTAPFTGVVAIAVVNAQRTPIGLYSNCGKWTEIRLIVTARATYCPHNTTANYVRLDSVIESKAIRYSGSWPNSLDEIRFDGSAELIGTQLAAFTSASGFQNGQEGVWRPSQNYLFAADRRQSTYPDLRRDGTFDNVALFNWSDDLPLTCATQWRKTQDATRYSTYGYVTERQDVLGVKTASLYSYRSAVNVAHGTNAAYSEIGFEGFEEYKPNQPVDVTNIGNGNIDFYTISSTEWVHHTGRGYPGWLHANGMVTFDPPEKPGAHRPLGGDPPPDFHQIMAPQRMATFEMMSRSGAALNASGRALHPRATGSLPNGGTFIEFDGLNPASQVTFPIGVIVKVSILDPQDYTFKVVHNTISITDARAHTGSNSLRVAASTLFEQPRLELTPGKAYVIGGWLSVEQTDAPTYRSVIGTPQASQAGLCIVFLDAGGAEIGRDTVAQPYGPVIDGWQRIDQRFVVPANTQRIAIATQPGASVAYFDDIRVFPSTGNLETYVYDPQNYRLVARLDDNDFAEFYSYDDEGSLTKVSRETIAGIVTVREFRTSVRRRP
jgi:hypothetical protein